MADPFLQQMIDAGMVDDRVRLLMQSMQRGQALRATPSAQGMNVGQTYRASSPLEHLATAMSRVKGEKMIGDAEGQMGGLLDQKRAGRMAFAEAASTPEAPASTVPPLLARPSEGGQWAPPSFGTQASAPSSPRPNVALLGALSGDPAMAAGGNVVLGQQAAQREGERFDKTFGAQEAARRTEAEHRAATLGETSRHNRATEGLTAEGLRAKTAEDAAKKADGRGKVQADLRKEFNNLPVVKKTQEVAEANAKIQTASPNGVGDVSLLVAYMKMIDPGSTVRENEFATAEQTPGAARQYMNLYNKILQGERLPESARQQFKAEAAKILGAQLENYNATADHYRRFAQMSEIDPGDVVMDLGYGQASKGGGGLAQVSSDADYNALPSGAEFLDPEGNRRRKP